MPPGSVIDVSSLKELSAPFWDDLRRFWADPNTYHNDSTKAIEPTMEWITTKSGVPWLELDIEIRDHEAMVEEALACRDLFVGHRGGDSWGWKSVALHGIDASSTRSARNYGYSGDAEAPYVWTDLAERCPTTTAFLKRLLAYRKLNRVRFMLLEPMGCILPHIDTWSRSLTGLNIALNNPPGAHFKLLERGTVPFRPGSAFLVDVSSTHSCVNLSNTPRVHIIAHGVDPLPEFEELICRSFQKAWGEKSATTRLL